MDEESKGKSISTIAAPVSLPPLGKPLGLLRPAIYGSRSCSDNRFGTSLVSAISSATCSPAISLGLRRCAPGHPILRAADALPVGKGEINESFPFHPCHQNSMEYQLWLSAGMVKNKLGDALIPLSNIESAPHTFVYFVTQMYGSGRGHQPTPLPYSKAKMLLIRK